MVKAFIEKIIQCPLQDIAIPLSGFRWEYNKGNFHHWRLLLLHFDTYFKTYLSCRNDLTLLDNLEDDSPLPKHAILQILRVLQIILENCPNKSSFDGLEHFKLLLASTDPEILIATLETLSALVKINPSKLHGSTKMICCGSVNSYLLSLAQGWGSKEEGLGLYSCVMANEKAQDEALCLFPSEEIGHDQSNCRMGTTLYFELHGPSAQSKEHSADAVSPGSTVIHMPDLHLRKEDDLSLMKQCIEQFSVPSELRFSLLTRIRYARAFRSPRICRLYSRICLLSFIVLVQSGDAQEELVSFFANEPEYTNELIRIVRSEEVISGSIRTLAMLALGAQLAAYTSSHHRARILSGSSLTFAGGNRMILLNVLQRAILSLKSSNDPSSLAFVEALLQFYLLHVVSTSTSGNNIRGSGMVPTFLPLLEDFDPTHIHLVCFAVKTLQKLMDYSSSAVSLFKELGGIELLAQRLQKEVHRVIGLVGETDNIMLTGESLRYSTDQLYSQKRLIKVSLKALGSATYAPANSTRSQHSQDSSLPVTLRLIFQNVDKFGGDIYYSAVTVMSEIIHKDPTCFSALHEMGLPDAFLLSVGSEILPSSKALTCIPNGLGAICLNAKGLEAVRESSSLRFLIDIFTSKKYILAMNEAIVPLANAVEELLRHVSTLRSSSVDIIIEIIHKIASFGDGNGTGFSGKAEGTAMETDSENKEKEGHCCIVGTSYSAIEGISDEQFIQLCVFHLMVLIHRTMENAETCRLFVEKSGIEALLNLLLRPTIAQSSDGMSIALHSTMVFKGFAQHHSIPLAHAFCSSLREHLKKALAGLGAASEPLLLDPRMTTDGAIFSSLFLVEFLLFLAAPKDNRWVTALLTEFGNGGKDVLEDIGRVHREVLWQIALLENRKPEIEEDGACTSDLQQAEGDASETEEQRLNSFRQFLDPLLRRRTSGWSIESQFFNLINLYRDLGRSTGSQHRSNLVGPRSSSSNQVQHSGSDDNSGTADKKESDKQRPYYTSCCDMVRSLSFHITHLFQELGKVMLLPSRRRDDVVNVSPASKSVASTFASIAFDHMNYGGRCVNLSGTEESISTKCRYFGKVIDFMDNVLMERPDSCNPIMLNCLYGRGVIETVLTTFEATSQLLFTVNRAPASPMDTDDANAKQDDKEDTDNSWIYGSLASYGKLMDHLVTSSFILSSFTKHLLAQPLTNGNTAFPRDAETFVKVLQSRVLKTVLPVWTHPQFVDCSYEFISTVISIIRHVYTGVEVKNVNGSGGARITGPPPNETTISTIVEMGFSRSRAEEALRQVGSNSAELAMEWLFSHPEEIQEDDELARALAMSLGNSESDAKDAVANDNALQLEEEMVQLPPVDELLSTCTKLLSKEPLAFPVRDLLVMICSHDDGHHRSNVVSFIVERIKECDSSMENNSVGLDNIFRSLRSGRHGHRLHLWTDNNQQSGGTNTAVVPQGLEELLVTQLRRPTPEKSSNQNIAEAGSHGKIGTTQAQDAGGARPEVPVESNAILEISTITPSIDNSNNADVRPAGTGPSHTNVSNTQSRAVEMQFEHTDGAVRDIEAVSQESSGSGATFGESLRSLEVEIGSADGHDDGGERLVSADRMAGDSQAARTRRANTPLSHFSPVVGRDVSLHSVTEVSENSSRDADQQGPAAEQQVNSDAGSGAIDPAFLDALPEELRAEVLSAQQGQVAQPSNVESQNTGDIDPEFLAALPADIRAEVLAQQQAQRLHQSQELEGQPVEMDTVLLTSPDTILANLTPALVAEANMLRERFAHRYSRTLFGMYPRSRRGETSRREGIGSGLDGAGGTISSRRSSGVKVVEADGAPLVDTEALHAMIRLFRVVQPLYKGQLQRLLLNLCAHSETRTSLVKILMDLLMLDVKRPVSYFSKVEPPYRLYGCQSNVMYSRPQSFDGVPPLLSRRILGILTYLARNHLYVAKFLLQCRLSHPAIKEPDDPRGKAVMVVEDEVNISESNDGYIAIAMLLGLLNQPLYLRSIAHLEQLLDLLDVIIDSAGNKSSGKSLIPTNPSSAPQISAAEADANADSNNLPSADDASKVDGSSKPTVSGINVECELHGVLSNLPKAELRLLCSLLAQEGLSDNAYNLVAEVMKKLVAIAPTHCELFVTELAEAVQKLTSSAMNELRVFSEAMKALLSTSSTDGAAILRVLQALSSLVTLLTEKENDRGTPALSEVWEINSALEPLWHELSCCISKIESYSESASEFSTSSSTFVSKPSGVMPPLPAGSQNILPYIESFFVVCEKLHPAQPGASHDSSIPVISDVEYATTSVTPQKASGTAVKVDEKHMPFVRFSEKHRKLLNAFIRQNPGLLEKSFSLMLKVPRFIDFDNKRAHFRSKIKHQHDHHHSPLRISVRRAYVLEDSYNQLRMRSTQDLKGRLTVHFQGEEGIDAGGLTREWYQLLSRVIFDKGALLFTTVGNESTFQPNPNSVYQTEHLSYFKFVGRVVGKALFDGQLLDVHFTRSFYKHILGVKNDISDVLDLTFSIDADEEKLILYERTEVTDYELIPGGRNIKVTEENKHQYVDLVAEHRLTTAIRPQINYFLEGFIELIPRELISIFNDKELELLISGLPDIDLDDLRANTEYSGYSAASPVIQWFWEVVQGLSKEDKARLLQFVTGTSKVPLEGFSALQGISGSQKFQIHKAYGSPDHLPSAHTCFNQLDLPEYPSKQHLEERLLLAIHEASEGFGFG
ncbi:E3 ubiquitin-protein ligase UPL1 [Glycine soja]|nr:E3 ubiquitin-protein ligase UPL1 [Glycine soja]